MVYMVDGVRYGMMGHSIFSPTLGAAILLGVAVVATAAVYGALRSGYKLRV
jgi:ABC-2 type transport system permease protein